MPQILEINGGSIFTTGRLFLLTRCSLQGFCGSFTSMANKQHYMEISVADDFPPLDAKARKELRASYAGETGAVWIYFGIILISYLKRDSALQLFAEQHLAEEQRHLALFEARIHRFRGSILQAAWMLAGFLIGALPALFGREWVYYTIWSVESFVDKHYRHQISLLQPYEFQREGYSQCLSMFRDCHAGELAHRDEAMANMKGKPTFLMKGWGKIIALGSRLAVAMARIT